ncbi:MAG: class I SAM-dependent methyltransferase [Gemmatimonadaceae bacterium]
METLTDQALVESTARSRAEEFIASIGAYPDTFDGRGIVMCGGGTTYFTNAFIAVSLLRHVGCTLPVQLWYLGSNEIDSFMEELIAPLGVECIDAMTVSSVHPARILRGWEVKPYAMLHCPFREVLLLDADNFVATNPEYLFESWEYRQTGALFWPDVGRMPVSNVMWDVFGVPFLDEPEFESGQVVVDKERCWTALSLTKFYNDHSDFFYRYVHGDKETFHFAFRKVKQPYAMTSHPMRLQDGTFFQHDFAGNLVFQHRNRVKWSYDGENPSVDGFQHEAECRRFLGDLRREWNGVVGGNGDRAVTEDVHAARRELTADVYRFVRDGYGYWPMSFMSDGRVGIGSTTTERTWDVYISGSRLALEIGAEGGPSTVLRRSALGWRSAAGETELALIPRKAGVSSRVSLSFNEFVETTLAYAEPLSQNTGTSDLGFGWIYYGIARNIKPDFAIVIGSARGFVPLCVARGLHDAGHGQVIFIDPAYRGSGDPAWDGRGHWEHASEVEKWFDLFGLSNRIKHLKMRSDDALPVVRELVAAGHVGLLVIDGAHTFEQSLRDFDSYTPLMSDGMVLFHDATNPNCGVSWTLQVLRSRGLDAATLNRDVGLSVVPIKRPPRVDDKWSYLTAASDRGRLIMEHLGPLVRPGDKVFEAYCGFSPLNAEYREVDVFGFDVDPAIIERLRTEYPASTWAQIEEQRLAYADLPEHTDVLIGLGLSYGYCSWDAQLVEQNIRFLVRHYRPRACLFETAADYHNGEILDAMMRILNAVGYTCREAIIETSMHSYHRRRLVIGTQA